MSADPGPAPPGPGYPPAPWRLHGDLWLSLFRAPDGWYGAAFVGYADPSPLRYHELLVARLVRDPATGTPRAQVTDIWVDSVASRDGGRALWAIPKDLADFAVAWTGPGPLADTRWAAYVDGTPIARARFRDVSRAAPRLPFRGSTWQPSPEEDPVVAPFAGSGRALPAAASWRFDPDGPLAFLSGRRPRLSVRLAGFAMRFG